MQLWTRLYGLGVARWPYSGGGAPWFRDIILSLAEFSILAPGFDETSFDLQL